MTIHSLRTLGASIAIAAMLTAIASCSGGEEAIPSYNHFENLGDEGWKAQEMLIFEPWPADSAEAKEAVYNLDMTLRHAMRKTPSAMPLVVIIEDEERIVLTDTLIINAADKTFKKTERYGVAEINVPIAKKLKLSEGMQVCLIPLLKTGQSRPYCNVGLTLKKSKP